VAMSQIFAKEKGDPAMARRYNSAFIGNSHQIAGRDEEVCHHPRLLLISALYWGDSFVHGAAWFGWSGWLR